MILLSKGRQADARTLCKEREIKQRRRFCWRMSRCASLLDNEEDHGRVLNVYTHGTNGRGIIGFPLPSSSRRPSRVVEKKKRRQDWLVNELSL